MQTSSAGLDLIKSFEKCVLTAYNDGVGVMTIGWGTTKINGMPIQKGMTITQFQADKMFLNDLAKFERAVERATYPKQLTQNQFDACVSLAYNIGEAGFRNSSVARYIKAGNVKKAADAFLMWNRAGGKVLLGLTRRRQAERELFLNDV